MSDKRESPLEKLLDASIVLAGATALLYYLNVIYIDNYLAVFGVDPDLFQYPLPDTLVAIPAIVLAGILALMVSAFLFTQRMKRVPSEKPFMLYTGASVFGFMFMLVFCLEAPYFIAKHQISYPQDNLVSFTVDNQKLEGYSLLARNGDYYYFYKPSDKKYPYIKIIEAKEVHDLCLRPESPAAISASAKP